MCHTCSRRVHPEETSVLTGQSCFPIANSFSDDLARLCDDALRGGIREHQHDKQKDNVQTRFDVQEARIAASPSPFWHQMFGCVQTFLNRGATAKQRPDVQRHIFPSTAPQVGQLGGGTTAFRWVRR